MNATYMCIFNTYVTVNQQDSSIKSTALRRTKWLLLITLHDVSHLLLCSQWQPLDPDTYPLSPPWWSIPALYCLCTLVWSCSWVFYSYFPQFAMQFWHFNFNYVGPLPFFVPWSEASSEFPMSHGVIAITFKSLSWENVPKWINAPWFSFMFQSLRLTILKIWFCTFSPGSSWYVG